MTFDADAIFRQVKPDRRRAQVEPAPSIPLTDIGVRAAVVLDTNIYIDMAAGRFEPEIRAKLAGCLHHHSIVALAELAQGVAAYSPEAKSYASVKAYYLGLFKRVPRMRLLVPDADVWMRAGTVAGLLSRTQGFQPHQRKELLVDALIYVDAAKHGLPVLTRNVRDFGLIAAVHGAGTVVQV